MLNPYEHEHADRLAETVSEIVDPLSELIERVAGSDRELIYVNDNYGDWNSSSQELVDRACSGRHPDLVEPILPPREAKFVIKARHSIFYGTPLEYLLGQLGIGTLVLTGQVTEQCILYSALDAHVRHFDVVVPTDGVAHIHEHLGEAAIEMMRLNMGASIPACADCSP